MSWGGVGRDQFVGQLALAIVEILVNVDLHRTRVPIDVAFLCLSVGFQTVEILDAVDHALPREFELG